MASTFHVTTCYHNSVMDEQRAIGIVRVSRVGKREGARFLSPDIQRERIEAACKQHGLRLVDTREELDISGGLSLDKRPELSKAVKAVEAGNAEAIVFAYRDRVDRSMDTASELCRRIDAAGGSLIADAAIVTHATHDGWRKATFESFLTEDQRRTVAEKMRAVQERCVTEGKPPWARVPLGYRRTDAGTYALDKRTAPLAVEAFEMRDAGASVKKIQMALLAKGVKLSHRGIQTTLANRAYLGELHFGDFANLEAWPPIIDRALFDRVQKLKLPRGPLGRSNALLARLRVLKCGSCGASLRAWMMPQGGGYPVYSCAGQNICPKHVTISARIADEVIVRYVKDALAGLTGTHSSAVDVAATRADLDQAQGALDSAVRKLADAGIGGESVALETLSALREVRDAAQERHDEAVQADDSLTVAVGVGDWDDLTRDGQRDLIRAVIGQAVVRPGGKGAERITIEGR
jgi:DNA invertase Pin-like site-specific DNA recombinase